MFFHTVKGRPTAFVGFLLVCRCRAGKLEAGNGWSVSLTLLMVPFLGSGREIVEVVRSAAAEEAKLCFFFFTKKFRDQKAHAISKHGGVFL